MKPTFHKSSRTLGGYLSLGFAVIISSVIYSRAGDILRGGGGSSSAPTGSGSGTGVTTPADTAQARTNAQDALARTSNALNAVRAMQDAARAAAISGPNNLSPGLPIVPNGIGINGLQVAPGVGTDPSKWQGADLPTETTDLQGLVDVGIRQTAQQALLQWQTFNVGKNTTVTFNQSAAGANAKQWIAFNQITDPTGNPSQILGQIKAQGQVYVINPNGVIFGGSSKVDVNTLTVSSLPINNNLINRGLLNNPDSQFLFSGLSMPAGPNGTPAFTPTAPVNSQYGDVIIQAGAQLKTSVSADGNGGRIALVGPNVSNAGSILTPNGQTIIASGLQVGFAAHNSADPSLRGLDVYVGQIGSYGGHSSNSGHISAPRGAITIAGSMITSTGTLQSSTSVSLNGRIELLAHYDALANPISGTSTNSAPFLNRRSGTVTLGNGSAIEILPEYSSTETTIGSVLALRSQINIEGLAVHLGENATILAPNALVRLAAGEWNFLGGISPTSTFTQSAGQVYLDSNSLVNVAGSIDVPVSVAQNIISVDLRGAELANSPLQRNGPLRGQSVLIDIRDAGIYESAMWIGTPLADVAGFANLIQRGVGQLTTGAGSVTISAGQSTVIQSGAKIDVSGGSIAYQAATVRTTRLITAGGNIVDIADARPDVIYKGIYDGSLDASNYKFGVTEIYSAILFPGGARFEQGYLQGSAGGSIGITTPALALAGTLRGNTFAGIYQRSTQPAGSSLLLDFTATDRSYPSLPDFAPTPPAIVFQSTNPLSSADPFQTDAAGNPLPLRSDLLANVYLNPDILTTGGFANFTLNNPDGTITIPEASRLTTLNRGNLSFTASNIDVLGSIIAPGATLSFTSPNLPLSTLNFIANNTTNVAPPIISGRGKFTLGATATISTAGLLVDDRLTSPSSGSDPILLTGGGISIRAFDTILNNGGTLDVSGGARSDSKGKITYGNAGSISLTGGRDTNIQSILGGSLRLGANLLGFSGSAAGSLSLTASAIQIGGTTSDPATLLLDPSIFNQGGFSTFNLTGLGLANGTPGILIKDGTIIRPIVSTRVATAAVGKPLAFEQPVIFQEGVRTTASLSFSSPGVTDSFTRQIVSYGEVIMESNTSIETDATGKVAFNGTLNTIRGSVFTPGGTISIAGAVSYPIIGAAQNALPTVHIGSSASLSTAGKQVLVSNPLGLRSGKVYAGGTISVSGNIVIESNALLDVSGASGILDLPLTQQFLEPSTASSVSGRPYVPVLLESNGGTIILAGSQMLFSDATLVGRKGGESAIGGVLSISSGRFLTDGTPYTTADANLTVRQAGLVLPQTGTPIAVGTIVKDMSGNPIPEQGYFSLSSIASGNFDSLTLRGNVRFEGNVAINLPGKLRVADGGVLYSSGDLNLSAGQIVLGQDFRTPTQQTNVELFSSGVTGSPNILPYKFAPRSGTGRMTVNAGLVDIGDLSLDGIGEAHFDASEGDIRGNGTFQMAGDLTLQAGQIYPTTQRTFGVFVYDKAITEPGKVTILAGSLRNLPYSAGGTLTIQASQISQAGTLRAPGGIIRLGWDGNGAAPVNSIAGNTVSAPVTSSLILAAGGTTSVSLIDPITGKPVTIPYGISFDGNSWIDPSGKDITVDGPPAKAISLAALSLVTEEGSSLDLRGGGDLYAYRWISGNGGRQDILSSSESFAIIPGYGFSYVPYAPFNNDSAATNLQGQTGYTNPTLKAGDQITLAASGALSGGTYTLLPARYALLPGAVLVTPVSVAPSPNSIMAPDGSSIVAGYRSNNLDSSRTGATSVGGFQIAPSAVIRLRAEYQDFLANTTFRDIALSRGTSVARLPQDAGYLSFTASASMLLRGGVSAISSSGRGGLVDINSSSNILINATGIGSGGLVLGAETLNQFGTESLLIGGLRSFGSSGVNVTVNSRSVTLDNAGVALTGKDIILVSRENLILAEDSAITTPEDDTPIDSLFLGDASVMGSGDGTLVRVSANASGQVFRSGVSSSALQQLEIRSGSTLTGGSLVIDSSSGTSLAQSVRLIAKDVFLGSGRISLALNQPGVINGGNGLLLGGESLSSLQNSVRRLSLLSYSSIDTYGTGNLGSTSLETLSLQAAAIRGFNTGGGNVSFAAQSITLGNRALASTIPATADPLSGSISFDAQSITLGSNTLQLQGFAQNSLLASGILAGSQGSLVSSGNLSLVTPFLTGANASNYVISTSGTLRVTRPVSASPSSLSAGFGASLTLRGSDVAINGDISLPSGKLTLHATSGDLVVGDVASAVLRVAGTSSTFVDTVRYTDGGIVSLLSDAGSVRLGTLANLDVSAQVGGGDAGTIQVKASMGSFDLLGTISGSAGSKGMTGSFVADTMTVTNGSLAALDTILNAGTFTRSRDYRIRTGDVLLDGAAISSTYRVTADSGNITVTGSINASGNRGGTIDLKANGRLTLASSAILDASAATFDAAGKGGSVILEGGSQRNGIVRTDPILLNLTTGSVIDLSVAEKTSASASLGKFSGTLHLRAPRNSTNSDLQLAPIGSTITGASAITVEGYKLYDLTPPPLPPTTNVTITSTIQTQVRNDANAYLGTAGSTTIGYSTMLARLTALNPALDLILTPGAEIINRTGDLTLGTTSSTTTSDWNLATFRFGPRSAAGVLTMRASRNMVFYNALSDGFAAVTPNTNNGQSSLWLAPLMAANPNLPANSQSWSYRLTSGSDLSSADFGSVLPQASLASGAGSFLLGKNYGNAATYGSGATHTTETSIERAGYQVIRTGSGDISIHSGRDVTILNQFATIYTAGTLVSNPTSLYGSGDFVVPLLLSNIGRHPTQGTLLGAVQQPYFVQYSMAGGNLSVEAANDVSRMTRNTVAATGGSLIDDSSRQLPNNWLYRRGYIDPATGASGVAFVNDGGASLTDPDASTTWWVDYSNFFEGLGTLGGGNIRITAGRDVKNIDAAAPTNARMASGIPSEAKVIELGGGDITVLSGRNIDAGVYYVERGHGRLEAGASIVTNSTRSPSRGILSSLTNPLIFDSNTWLATTLFVGKGGFDVQASGDLLLGPVSNPFWLPQGINNKFWYKTYFNTYAADSYVDVISLGGSVTHRAGVSLPTEISSTPALDAWLASQQSMSTTNGAANFQPWLRTVETDNRAFKGLLGIMTPTIRTTSFSGEIKLVGDITLAPSPVGQIEMVAGDSISGLQPSGFINNLGVQRWITSTINLSDADPKAIPGIASPYAYLQVVGSAVSAQRVTGSGAGAGFLGRILSLFNETGSSNGVLQDEQARHTPGNLHANDHIPLRIYAQAGDIDGFRLFSPKETRVIAGRDIGDVALYIQNLDQSDLSVVSAGRDLVLYNENSESQRQARTNTASNSSVVIPTLDGDIQISGPGGLQVMAGRNLDLGFGSGNADGTGSGISSIGNARNPYLTLTGAEITAAAGIGFASGLSTSSLAFAEFETLFVETDQGRKYLAEIAPGVDYDTLDSEQRAQLAMEVFYLILRDTGRNFNDPESPGYRSYDNGLAAISSLFPESVLWDGSILTRSRDIRTRSGGDILIFSPGGRLELANTTIGNPLTPPGIVTESGGTISIFTDESVDIGIGRIFTLKGGDVTIWSSNGNIAAGSSSRTISSAPPTRVIIDPQSASVQTDLAGLATGGGIGVLATLEDVDAGDVDLIAPSGFIDAGDAGIRVSGNINLAALTVVNAGNISSGGASTGGNPAVSTPSVATVTTASNSAAATSSAPLQENQNRDKTTQEEVASQLSVFEVVVLGYGGGDSTEEDEKDEKKDKEENSEEASPP